MIWDYVQIKQMQVGKLYRFTSDYENIDLSIYKTLSENERSHLMAPTLEKSLYGEWFLVISECFEVFGGDFSCRKILTKHGSFYVVYSRMSTIRDKRFINQYDI